MGQRRVDGVGRLKFDFHTEIHGHVANLFLLLSIARVRELVEVVVRRPVHKSNFHGAFDSLVDLCAGADDTALLNRCPLSRKTNLMFLAFASGNNHSSAPSMDITLQNNVASTAWGA